MWFIVFLCYLLAAKVLTSISVLSMDIGEYLTAFGGADYAVPIIFVFFVASTAKILEAVDSETKIGAIRGKYKINRHVFPLIAVFSTLSFSMLEGIGPREVVGDPVAWLFMVAAAVVFSDPSGRALSSVKNTGLFRIQVSNFEALKYRSPHAAKNRLRLEYWGLYAALIFLVLSGEIFL